VATPLTVLSFASVPAITPTWLLTPWQDPFWDPPEDVFLGSVYLYLQGLQYCIDADETLSITNYQGGEEGLLHVSICFCTHQGQPLGDKVAMTDDPQVQCASVRVHVHVHVRVRVCVCACADAYMSV
jgi:hypothetical protein